MDQVNIIFDVVADILYIFQFSNYKCLQTHTCNSSKIKIWNSFLDQVNICEITQNISCLILVKTKFRIRCQIQWTMSLIIFVVFLTFFSETVPKLKFEIHFWIGWTSFPLLFLTFFFFFLSPIAIFCKITHGTFPCIFNIYAL